MNQNDCKRPMVILSYYSKIVPKTAYKKSQVLILTGYGDDGNVNYDHESKYVNVTFMLNIVVVHL